MRDSHTTPCDATPNAAPVTLQRNRRARRLHNARTDVVERTRWVPFAPTDSLSPALTVQETPVPEAVEVRVVSYVGKRYAMQIASLLQNYRLAPEDVEIVERTPRRSAPVEPLAVLPPAVVAEVSQGQLETASRLDVQAPVAETVNAASASTPMVEPAQPPADIVVRMVDGWRVSFTSDDEPRMMDTDLGERLGYARPVKIRDLIKRLVDAGKLNGIHQVPTVGKAPGQVAARTVTVYYLTEAQALKVAAKSETEPADALLNEMIAVYQAARRGANQAADRRIGRLEAAVAMLAAEQSKQTAALTQVMETLATTVQRLLPAAPAAPPPAPEPGPRPEQEVAQFPPGWRTRAQFRAIIAAKLGEDVSEQRVGNALQALGMKDRGKDVAVYKLVEQYANGAHFHVPAWAYHPAITEELAAWVRANPVRRRRTS